MKYIKKGDEPQSFTDWKNLANEDWQPTYDKLSGREKRDVKNTLIKEQGGICCYCERELKYSDSHIEHLNPQSNSEEEQLNFDNLLCSCQGKLEKREPQHCGNSKGDEILPITPLQNNCANQFTYTEDGYIGFIDEKSKKTIKILQLDIDKLNNLRNKAIEPFVDEELSIEEVQLFAQGYLKQENGKYNEFYTTIKYLFT